MKAAASTTLTDSNTTVRAAAALPLIKTPHTHTFALFSSPLSSLLHRWVQGWRGAAVWACHVWDIPGPAKGKRGQGRGGRKREERVLKPRKKKKKTCNQARLTTSRV